MQYALNIILNTLLTITASLALGWLFNNFTQTLIFYFCFSVLRLCSGGFHLKTAAACNVVTTLICVAPPLLINITGTSLWIINALSFFIMLLFAPNPDKNAQIPFRYYPGLKLASIVLVGLNFFIGSSVIGLAYLVQSLTVIPWKGRLKV
ncbi:accessory gene regulator B family protein [Paenibacillus tianjinensis]|jgi:accessory gene regulator B|uniref:Accessory gene regulator B family protein n=2 Tax=Paenibacillus TaxID=44249 RepID=A0ABX7LIM5_9BACL|nr:accessory gene regulator B family protein [Paenibacillus tianjinensis]QSF47871.1 accessory gene regulator B family protein [Paenibacillus tianjinensis]